jgi:hypothetical protein
LDSLALDEVEPIGVGFVGKKRPEAGDEQPECDSQRNLCEEVNPSLLASVECRANDCFDRTGQGTDQSAASRIAPRR